MSTVLKSLLALQDQDDVVDALRSRIDSLEPRLAALDAARAQAERVLNEVRGQVAADEHHQRELEGRLSDHRTRHERNLSHLDAVKRMREATAAMAQVEAGRKVLLDEESELRSLVGRVADGHASIKRQEEELVALDAAQADARTEIAAERAELDRDLASALGVRSALSAAVQASLLTKYDRIRSRRRSRAVFALSGHACGCCDTAIPVQRRTVMATTGAIDVCEACGVLLYASN